MKLYTYFRSSAAYRVRIALNYKGIPHELIPVNLLQDEQHCAAYKQKNPQMRVPTLIDGTFSLGQSSAILEYLEEKVPSPALLPADLETRAWVRYLSQMIISDVHPLNNSSVIHYLKDPLSLDAAQIQAWYHHWIKQGFDALEALLSQDPRCGLCCVGDQPTFADVALVPQVYNAYRFKYPMEAYPTLDRINTHCLTLPAFDKARPERQADCVRG